MHVSSAQTIASFCIDDRFDFTQTEKKLIWKKIFSITQKHAVRNQIKAQSLCSKKHLYFH